jgi:large subunit ribosomal protein L15
MALNSLKKIKKNSKKRVGQGHGSGKVKTGGRGTKGQKARNKSFRNVPLIVNLKHLAVFSKDQVVDLDSLIKNKIVKADDAKEYGVKILGDGEIKQSLIIKLPISKSAAQKIEKAGGRVEL